MLTAKYRIQNAAPEAIANLKINKRIEAKFSGKIPFVQLTIHESMKPAHALQKGKR